MAFAQISSNQTKVLGPHGSCTPIAFNSTDAMGGDVKVSQYGMTVPTSGNYLIVAAPQVGGTPQCSGTYDSDFWMRVNGQDLPNSNVRLQAACSSKDVIVTQGITHMNAGDTIEVCGSGRNAQIEAIQVQGEPLIPSFIGTLVRL